MNVETIVHNEAVKLNGPMHRSKILFVPFGVSQEFSQTNICQGMFQKSKNRFQRTGNHIRSGFRTINNMERTADRCGQYFGFKPLYRINIRDLRNQFNAIPARVVNPANKRRYIFCADFCRQYSLSRRKNTAYSLSQYHYQ